MAALDWAVECLRPLVKTSTWDYCIVWKFGDDPSSFIQWRGCCCSGGNYEFVNVKGEGGTDEYLPSHCRDEYAEHTIRTKACEKLCKFPSSVPLYSGIHGEVVLSNQPRWLTLVENANNKTSNEAIGTQVLVPVEGGLVELFSTKEVPINHQIINFILAQYCCVEQETMAAEHYAESSGREPKYKLFLDECLMDLTASIRNPNFISKIQLPPLASNSGFYPSLEESFNSSNLPKDYQLLTLGSGPVSCHTSPEKSSATYPRNLDSTTKRDASCAFDAGNEELKPGKKTEKEPYHSKNLITERKRRQRINHGILTLRSLVPNISKMDKASTLGDACNYIQELQMTRNMYEDELRNLTEECNKYNAEQEAPELTAELEGAGDQPTLEHDSSADDKKQAKVEIEVSQIGASDFLVEIICRKRRGGFLRLLKAMDSSGVQVIDANVTTLNGLVLNILKVQAFTKDTQPEDLKDSLTVLICQDGQGIGGGKENKGNTDI